MYSNRLITFIDKYPNYSQLTHISIRIINLLCTMTPRYVVILSCNWNSLDIFDMP